MSQQLTFLFVLAMGFGTPVNETGVDAQKPRDSTGQQKVACWPGTREIQNLSTGKKRPTPLPPELANETVRRSVMVLKLCVSETGHVARVIVIESSGSAAIDKYYSSELSKWIFTPAERNKKRVPSVVPVAVTLYIK